MWLQKLVRLVPRLAPQRPLLLLLESVLLLPARRRGLVLELVSLLGQLALLLLSASASSSQAAV
jgi:hypothetical protein